MEAGRRYPSAGSFLAGIRQPCAVGTVHMSTAETLKGPRSPPSSSLGQTADPVALQQLLHLVGIVPAHLGSDIEHCIPHTDE